MIRRRTLLGADDALLLFATACFLGAALISMALYVAERNGAPL